MAWTPVAPAHLEEANDRDIPAIYQCLGTLFILQPGGTGPHPPPQPLSDAVGLPGACEESPQPGPRPAHPAGACRPYRCTPPGVCGSRHGRT